MKFSLHLPMFKPEFLQASAIKTMAQAADRAGIDACNLTDHPAPTAEWRRNGGHDAFDPFVALAFIAAATTHIRLHTHILVVPYRNPFLAAKSAASVDVLSEGRLILGLGLGYQVGEYAALGVDFAARGAIMDETIQVMKMAWSGEPVNYQGRNFKAEDILPQPAPLQKPHPPLWGGGNAAPAIRRAAELCDGWSPFFASPAVAKATSTKELVTLEDLKAGISVLRHHLERVGRVRPFDICAGLPGGERLKACSPADAQRVVDRAGQMAEMGVTWMLTSLPSPSLTGFLENIQWFSEEVMPKVKNLQPAPLFV